MCVYYSNNLMPTNGLTTSKVTAEVMYIKLRRVQLYRFTRERERVFRKYAAPVRNRARGSYFYFLFLFWKLYFSQFSRPVKTISESKSLSPESQRDTDPIPLHLN